MNVRWRREKWMWAAWLWAVVALGTACGGEDGPSEPGDATSDVAPDPPGPLGAECREAADCISGVCLRSEYGPPFCSRACDNPSTPCDGGDDAPQGQTLCVSYAEPPNPQTPPFKGDMQTFCVPTCQTTGACEDANANWEICDVPKWLGDPLYPNLGGIKVCLAPSYQGKDPVDPALCDWEKTIDPAFASEANLCRSYCEYLQRCKEIAADADLKCCEWGCFNQMVVDDERVDAWYDVVKCHIETHAAFPEVGQQNACSEPPKQCCEAAQGCPDYPPDPTPPAATE